MRQELIDLLRGELDPVEAEALRARIQGDPALSREAAELQALFGLLRRGEEVEPSPAARARIRAAARPSLVERLAALPSLVRYRLRYSVAFRVAAVSLAVHLVAMGVLFKVVIDRPNGTAPEPPVIGVAQDKLPVLEPDAGFQVRLRLRRVPHAARLRQFGAERQAEAIDRQLAALLDGQRPDGSFGGLEETAVATLGLLAEGDCSTLGTRRGRAVASATRHLFASLERGERSGAVLAALVEDYVLSYEDLGEAERADYVRGIRRLIRELGSDDFTGEAYALARLAGFAIPAGRDFGEAASLLGDDRSGLLDGPPSRIAVTAVLARGRLSLDPERVREWARPLFEGAVEAVEGGRGSGIALLALQAPYRL